MNVRAFCIVKICCKTGACPSLPFSLWLITVTIVVHHHPAMFTHKTGEANMTYLMIVLLKLPLLWRLGDLVCFVLINQTIVNERYAYNKNHRNFCITCMVPLLKYRTIAFCVRTQSDKKGVASRSNVFNLFS